MKGRRLLSYFRLLQAAAVVVVVVVIIVVDVVDGHWVETPPWMDELFGDGDLNQKSVQLIQKHLSR